MAPAALLVALELVLRVAHPAALAGESWSRRNPAGMSLFEIKDEQGVRSFRPSAPFRAWGMDYNFHEPKPPGVFRIFALGESSVYGGAFCNPGAFPRQLYAMLSAPAAQVIPPPRKDLRGDQPGPAGLCPVGDQKDGGPGVRGGAGPAHHLRRP